ncbi:DNA replication factor Cdt1 [Eumeta japonica]|uniref:DNA replication factor Cdt1 n=1 Tax=Eumeta variegata TaxID=151549 RepID=A0A4C1TYD5_EUMVA|nr:DNA replication factor Cdt1 [Eumeta japonica]
MSQKTITAYFSSRKRPATEDIVSSKNKILHLDRNKCKVFNKEPILFSPKNCELRSIEKVPNSVSKNVKSNECKANEIRNQSCIKSGNVNETKSLEVFAKKTSANVVSNTNVNSKQIDTNKARKELSLGDLKKRLSNSPRLAEIRAAADRISKGIKLLTEEDDKKNLKEFKSINIEVPSSPNKKTKIQNELLSPKNTPLPTEPKALMSPRKVVVSPIKSPSKVPAYMRHASLATSSTSLPLPHHYRFLAELFRGMETVVSLLFNRNEKITFSKLKPSVQEMLKRNFTERHLSQIKHLVPDFYNFEIQKTKPVSSTSIKESYELIISPNFHNHLKVMNPTVLLERRRYFYDILLQLVKKHHSQYLQTLDPPMLIPDDKLTRWHPEFELEKVPDVECAKLPEIPSTETYSTAQDVLAKARELFKCNTKMERALEKLAQAKARGLTEKEQGVTGLNTEAKVSEPSASNITILNPALRNLPPALLEKVKAKQAAKALEAMTRTTEAEKKYMLYSRLPDLIRSLRNIFVTERKNVLALKVVLSKLNNSFKYTVSATDLQRDIKILSEEIPTLITLQNIRNTDYVKLDKNADIKKIQDKLEALAQKYKSE